MGAHSLFAPSAAARWLSCPGSVAYDQDDAGSVYADEGSAAHILAKRAFDHERPAAFFVGEQIQIGGRVFTVDDDMAYYVQKYLDEIGMRAMGGVLLTEQRLDLSEVLQVAGQFGTSDAIIIRPRDEQLIVADLKYGRGEIVEVEGNPQMMLYALGALEMALLFCERITRVTLLVSQPRVGDGSATEWTTTPEALYEFAALARGAVCQALECMTMNDAEVTAYLNPTPKGCRWCKVAGTCNALAAKVQEEVRADFEAIHAEAPSVPDQNAELALRFNALPLIEHWCVAVRAEISKRVTEGQEIVGTDGLPMKLVEGRAAKRVWTDKAGAELALVGHLGPKAYEPQEIISVAAAAKLLNKKKTKAVWDEILQPLVRQPPGKVHLALGSDPRPAFVPAAAAAEFEDESTNPEE